MSSSRSLIIGLDFGSDSVRALLLDGRDGAELAVRTHPYRRWAEGKYCDASGNRFRQHPLDYLEGTETVIRGLLTECDPARVAAIGIDTTGSTPCAVDRHGTPLALLPEFAENPNAMFILWKDHTALAEAAEINDYAARQPVNYLQYEGGIYSSEWFWSKILHTLRADPAVRAAADNWVEHCDWITHELIGDTAPERMKRSRCAAGHKAMWHASWGGLPPEEFFAGLDPLLAGLRGRFRPDTFTADMPTGRLSPRWAEKLGLSTDVVVAGGVFDCHAGAVGARIEPGMLVKVIGTSTCDIMVAPRLEHCVRGICGQVDGSVIPGMTGLEAGQSAFGDVYAWFRRLLGYAGDVSLPQLEADAAAVAPGSTPLLALDWFNGRRTPDADQRLTGALLGMNLGTTAPMIFRALAESTAFGARRIAERFAEEGIPVKSVCAIGGIARKSQFIMSLCADVMDMPIKILKSDQACALGAAIFGATAAGLYPDVRSAAAVMGSRFDAVYTPDPDRAAIYRRLYRKYRRYAAAIEKEMIQDV